MEWSVQLCFQRLNGNLQIQFFFPFLFRSDVMSRCELRAASCERELPWFCFSFSVFPFLFHLQRPHFIVDAVLLFLFPVSFCLVAVSFFRNSFCVSFLHRRALSLSFSLQRYGNGNGNATCVFLPIRKHLASVFWRTYTDKQCKNSIAENVEIMRNEERMKEPNSRTAERQHNKQNAHRGTNFIFDYIYLF